VGLRAVFGLTGLAGVALALGELPAAPARADSAAVALAIDGPTTCPTPAEVAYKLRPLLGDGGIGQPGDRVRIDRDDQALRVALVGADGRVRGLRQVDQSHDCDDLAEAAAIIVASWQAQPGSPGSGADPGATTTTPAAIGLSATSIPRIAAGDTEPAGARWFAGLGIAGNAVAGGADAVVPALTLEANVGRHLRGIGAHLRAIGGGRHTQTLPNGHAQWRRWALALGPALSWASQRVVVEADLSAAAALLALDGTGFAGNESHTMLDLGASTGVRARTRRGLCAFAGLGAAFWPRRTIAYQAPDLVGAALPRWQWLLEAGIGWDR
jgi:hypothetical protein